MSMTTALSGLMAAQTDISNTANNIANVGTMGFRGSRVEFADVYSTSPMAVQNTQIGTGTRVQRVTADFTQGNVVTTGNLLDMAIQGQGFFAVQQPAAANGSSGQTLYTRAGAFTLDADGTVQNASNQALLCWPTGADGVPLSTALGQAVPLTIPQLQGTSAATTTVNLDVSLPSDSAMLGDQAAVPPSAAFDPTDSTTYAYRTNIPVFDANGKSIEAEAYFVKTAAPSASSTSTTWEMHLMVNGSELPATAAGATITFDASGAITSGATRNFTDGGTSLAVNLTGSTLTTGTFTVESATHDGQSAKRLTNLEVDNSGAVWATYGGGNRTPLGAIVMATFANTTGLRAMGEANYSATTASGSPILGLAGSPGFGSLQTGALERANVELTEELVNLISAQRNYQANAKAMETSTSLMQTIMNIRN